ncbi:MAG: metalloregulator ArsR/SmtB family transcription factor [Acidobacteriia bacterium]|nr:metalloregulator ArsR/SmtB family transcription factor [Terriglobia bacterium]
MRNQSVTYSGHLEDADAFRAVADPTRRAVLDLLRRGSLPAGDIARNFPVSRPAISKHLRVLRAAELVREERVGRQRMYRLNAGPLRNIDGWLERYRQFWQANLANLKKFAEAQEKKKPKLQ